jgi:uncharacterized protein DUF559
VARHPIVPPELRGGPFTLNEARLAGLTPRQLQGASWRRITFNRYVWVGLGDTPELTLATLHQRLPPGSGFSGATAGWLYGLDYQPCDPVEATIPKGCGSSALAGVAVRRAALPESDLVVRRGFRTTSPVRTVFDLGSRPPLAEAVVAVDSALRAGLVVLRDLRDWAAKHAGSKGIKQFRRVVDLAEPATESPMESRLRMVLIMGGLPRPEVQVSLHDEHRRFLGRADLYYPAQRLVLEYDGSTHRTSLIEDNRRQNLLINVGFRILRFTFADVNGTPDAVVSQVRAALRRVASLSDASPSHARP